MKKNILQFLLLLISAAVFAQAPDNISFQAVIRKADGSVVSLTKVSFKFSIHINSSTGAVVYEETQSIQTNRDGLATLRIGAGTSLIGNFTAIDWSTGLYFVRTKVDVAGGTNFLLFSVSQLSSVPYAFFATEAGSIEYANIKNAPNVDSLKNSIDSEHAKQVALKSKLDSIAAANPAHFIGEHFGGGIVFYVYDNGKHGLVYAQNTNFREIWSPNGQVLSANFDGVNAGKLNTEIILKAYPNVMTAAKRCADYVEVVDGVLYADWYLPSVKELWLLQALDPLVNAWTSNETTLEVYQKFNALVVIPNNMQKSFISIKTYINGCIPIRSF
jgi:hypothetical protein